jgi:hypothetical protein
MTDKTARPSHSASAPGSLPPRHLSTNRRRFLQGLTLAGAALTLDGARAWADVVKLPSASPQGGLSVTEALAKRQSIREFSSRVLPQQTLANILWAAFGINRPASADHTAPSWRGSKETDVYVATAEGVWLFEPKTNELRSVMTADIRAKTSSMVFAATAPVVLIYVADTARMAPASADDHRLYAHVDTAMIGQNVYLYAAATGLGTVILGSIDRPALAKTLNLPDSKIVTFSQPIGFPP